MTYEDFLATQPLMGDSYIRWGRLVWDTANGFSEEYFLVRGEISENSMPFPDTRLVKATGVDEAIEKYEKYWENKGLFVRSIYVEDTIV